MSSDVVVVITRNRRLTTSKAVANNFNLISSSTSFVRVDIVDIVSLLLQRCDCVHFSCTFARDVSLLFYFYDIIVKLLVKETLATSFSAALFTQKAKFSNMKTVAIRRRFQCSPKITAMNEMNHVLFTAMLYNFNKTFRRCEYFGWNKSVRYTGNNANRSIHILWLYSLALIFLPFFVLKLRKNHCVIKFLMNCNRFSGKIPKWVHIHRIYSLSISSPISIWSTKIHQKWCRVGRINCHTCNWNSSASSYSAVYRFFPFILRWLAKLLCSNEDIHTQMLAYFPFIVFSCARRVYELCVLNGNEQSFTHWKQCRCRGTSILRH